MSAWRFSETSQVHVRRSKGQAEALLQEWRIRVIEDLQITICLALPRLGWKRRQISLLQTHGYGLADLVQGEAGDLARRGVLVICVQSVVISAANVDELYGWTCPGAGLAAVR